MKEAIAETRRKTNPLYNNRKLKLGTFSTNLGGGCAITLHRRHAEGGLAEHADTRAAREEMEFEALVPVGRLRGFGGVTNFNGPGLKRFPGPPALARPQIFSVFATSHVPTVHPIMAAKQCTTIDHITGGRFTLNVVTGWAHKPEIEMFGIPLLEHDRATTWPRNG